MSRLKKLMNDFKMLKEKVRLEKDPKNRTKLVAQLLLIRGQHREHNLILIKKRKYAESWRLKNRIKITNYNKMYARMRRERIRNMSS